MTAESRQHKHERASTASVNGGGSTFLSMDVAGGNGTPPMPPEDQPSLLEHALDYAGRGWRVFPLRPGDKRPQAGLRWREQATADVSRIGQWWTDQPDANIAVTTGEASGIYVIDIDSGHGGHEALAELEAEHGHLPDTFRVRTGGGGEHVYFRFQEGLANTVSKLGEGIDTRGEGGYVATAPSLHSSGAHYEVVLDAPLAELPEWILQKLREKPPSKVITATSLEQHGRILEGTRNHTLTSLGGYMRRRGLEEEAIFEALSGINRTSSFREVTSHSVV